MPKFVATHLDEVEPAEGYAAPRSARGVRSSRRVSPEGYSTWMVVAELEDGAELRWEAPHGDDGVYVMQGALDVDGRRCPTDGALIVESDARCTARAVGPTKILHMGSVDDSAPADGLYGAPKPDGHGVHVVGERGWYASGDRENVVVRWFGDSTCETCRIALFHVWRREAGVKDIPHWHTQDELIYVLGGSIVMGRREFPADTVLAIPAEMQYSVTSGREGYAFLNFRRDVSTQHYMNGKVGGKPSELEGALARGGRLVGDLR